MTEEEPNQKSLERPTLKLQDEFIDKKQEKTNEKNEEPKNNNDGSTLYVTNLSPKTTTEKLQEVFKEFGNIEKCYVICNPITGESRNFGFVTFQSQSDAQKAMINMNEKNVEGKPIKIEVARRNEPHEPTPGQYKGVRAITKRNGKSAYRRGLGYPYERRRAEPRRYNPPHYDDQIRGSSRNRYRTYGDRSYRHKHRGELREYDRRSYASRSAERRSTDRKSHGRRSNDRRSIDKRSNDKKSIDRKSYGRRRATKRSLERYPSEKSYDKHPRRGENYKKTSKYTSRLLADEPLSYEKYDKKKMKYNRSRRSYSGSFEERKHHRGGDSISNHNRSPHHRRR